MMTRIGIVADDLTGAGDTAVQFVHAGWQTELWLRPAMTPAATSAHVIAVTTDSRSQTAQEAAASVSAAVKHLRVTNAFSYGLLTGISSGGTDDSQWNSTSERRRCGRDGPQDRPGDSSN